MKRKRGFTLVELMIVLCLICIIFSIMAPNFMRARAMAQYSGCQSNLKSIAAAAELYANDNASRYPVAKDLLTPHYIATFPLCPSCGLGYSYSSSMAPDSYTIWCGTAQAHVMVGVPDGYPQYFSGEGGQAK